MQLTVRWGRREGKGKGGRRVELRALENPTRAKEEDRTEGERSQHRQQPGEHSSLLRQFTALLLPRGQVSWAADGHRKSVVSIIHSTLRVQQSHSGFYKILAFSRDII